MEARAFVLVCAGLVSGCDAPYVILGGAPLDGGDSSSAPPPGACGLAQPSFCETFDTLSAGGRGGDIDERVWSFTRYGQQVQYLWQRAPASTYTDRLFPATFCGQPFSGILPDADVRICDGTGVDGATSHQLNEVFDDQGGSGVNAMRVRQPFDFTDRTGTLVWDVDAKVNPYNLGHGWWIEIWITADPSPMPMAALPTVTSYPRKGVGFVFRSGGDCPEDAAAWQNALDEVDVVDDFQLIHSYPFYGLTYVNSDDRCFRVADARLNHFELHLSKDQGELWVSDYDDPTHPRLRATTPPLDLGFTRGYVTFAHVGSDAAKDGLAGCGDADPTQCTTPSQTFRWDNIGFDGPLAARPRAYDVAENGAPGAGQGILLGWPLSQGETRTFPVHGVDLTGAARAWFDFALNATAGQVVEYQINGGATHTMTVPQTAGAQAAGIRGYSVDAPLAELVDGDNVLALRVPSPTADQIMADVDLTVDTQ